MTTSQQDSVFGTKPATPFNAAGTPSILAIGTAVPPYRLDQAEIGEWMASSFADRPAIGRMLRMLHAKSGIATRYTCLQEYLLPPAESRYAPGRPANTSPTTAERMAVYAREATPLGCKAAHRALTGYTQASGEALDQVLSSVTHLVVVSCTGFFAPGLDFMLAQQLGLSPTVNRTLIGFMGCAAMFNGLRMAAQIVRADSQARVLVVSVELCSLHSQSGDSRDLLLAASLFGDGASACLVGRAPVARGDYFGLQEFISRTKPDTESEMAWTIGDRGFHLRLSPRIPEHLAEAVPGILEQIFEGERPRFWAIHPGGRAIVDRLAEILALQPEQTDASRTVLHNFGNLSSATLLFVLAEIRKRITKRLASAPWQQNGQQTEGWRSGIAMAFGPGLVIEMARLVYVPPLAPVTERPMDQVQLAAGRPLGQLYVP